MTDMPEPLAAFLRALGIATQTVGHPPFFTVEEGRAYRDRIPGAHTKSLFLKDKKSALFLVVAEQDATIDLKGLHRRIGAAGRLSFASPAVLAERLGVVPGAVTPFALINDRPPKVKVILDAALLACDEINCHPLANTATTTIARGDFVTFLHATDHAPETVAFDETKRPDQL